MKTELGIDDLKDQLEDLHRRYPTFKPDDLFVAWFLRAYLTDDEKSAATAVTGGAGDKSVDAVLVDHQAKAVFLVQGKYRDKLSAKTESRNDVIGFASLAEPMCEADNSRFGSLTKKMNPHVASLLSDARKFVVESEYRLWLYYVTLGKVSPDLADEAQETVSNGSLDAVIEVIDGARLMHVLRDYLDGVAPPIPTLDLEMEQHAGVKVNGVLQRFDSTNKIESWVFSMRGDAVAQMYNFAGIRLFARNIRGFLGDNTAINKGMSSTLETEPDHFFYYNNGITIICDRAEKRSRSGADYLRVSNPQVINGQQTSRMLAIDPERAAAASVLVKVMQVPREPGVAGGDGFDCLVSRIVANTNWQNAINYADLVSNDRTQIEIDRALRKIGYHYLRKRQKLSEARKAAGKSFFIVGKGELAQAVAGCNLDPVIVRQGKNNLFAEELYKTVFPCTDPNFYLPRYWLVKCISQVSRGFPNRAYAKWLVLSFLWSQFEPMLKRDELARRFRLMCERKEQSLLGPLTSAIETAFHEVLQYYEANKGSGETTVDHSAFFRNKRGRDREFATFWNTAKRRPKFETQWSKVRQVLT